MTTHVPRPVLVGLDGSNHATGALDWAIAEAKSRSLPLHLVHALETGVTVWSPMMVVPTDLGNQRWIVEAALEHVAKVAPEVSVTSAITSGPASVALEDASADADTIVVGARGRGVVGSILLGSTSLHVVGHARCPVVVVRDEADEADDAERRQPRRVTVGFDGSHLSDDALAFAFAAASHRHLPLDIVIAWDTRELATYQLAPSIAEEVRAAATHHRQELATTAAAPWAEKYPDVESTVHVVTDEPAQALVDRSVDSALVVVGSRGLGSVRGALMGSVSADVLRHAHSPVAVIRPNGS
jgi:nucleotide-binding universal stress UspA family protein